MPRGENIMSIFFILQSLVVGNALQISLIEAEYAARNNGYCPQLFVKNIFIFFQAIYSVATLDESLTL